MANRRKKNAPFHVPIPSPQLGVRPVVYSAASPWNTITNSSSQAHRQRTQLSYHSSDVSDFSGRFTDNVFSRRSPEFANHLKYQPRSEPQRILRSGSANSLQLLEQIVNRQDLIRKKMRGAITEWKIVAKDIPKPGKKISVNDQMKRIRGLCHDIDQHLRGWKDEIYRLTGRRVTMSSHNSSMDDNDLKETSSKQTTVSQNQGNELKNLEKCLQDVKKENSKSKEKIAALEGDLRKVIQEKEELLTRLSQISGSRLTDGNVQFTDLNTQNRPTKIAENFRELYNDEWMEALEVLPNDSPDAEKKSISTLLYIVQSSFEYCSNESKKMNDRLVSAVYGDGLQSSELNDESKRLILQLQKSTADVMASGIAQKFCSVLDIDENFEHPLPASVKEFAEGCVKVTWCMAVQSPPMHIVCNGSPGSELDRNLFSEYTQQGEKLDFIVWPAVLIENGGALLSKGVAQPLKKAS